MVFYRPLYQRIFVVSKVESTDVTGGSDTRFGRKILSQKEPSHHPPAPIPTPTPKDLGFVREDKSIQLLGTNIMDKDKCTGCKVFPKKIAVYPFDESVQLQGTNILEKKYIEYKIVHTKKLMFQKFPK